MSHNFLSNISDNNSNTSDNNSNLSKASLKTKFYQYLNIGNRINKLTMEEFNNLLENNKPYNKEFFQNIKENEIIKIGNSFLNFNKDLNVLVCSVCNEIVDFRFDKIKNHFLVSFIFLIFFNLLLLMAFINYY